jgi:hypothetical protein
MLGIFWIKLLTQLLLAEQQNKKTKINVKNNQQKTFQN